MADALISLLIETLGSMAFQKIKDEVGLVTGVGEEVEKLTNTFLNIQAVLEDAEMRQLTDPAVGIWLEKLKDVSLDIDDVLDEWMTPSALKAKMEEAPGGNADVVSAKKKVWLSLLSLCICSGGCTIAEMRVRHRIAQEIRDLNESLDTMAKNKDRFKLEKAEHVDGAPRARFLVHKITSCLINEKEVCGRDVEKEVLVHKLVPAIGKSEPADKGFGIVAVVGMGGLGKTTLAQLAYNDDRVKNHFDHRIWVCVSDPFEQIRVSKAILEGLNCRERDSDELNQLVQRIHGLVEGKRFLLVLDDVWNENYDKWEELEKSLMNGAAGSMILMTTRKEKVAATMRVAKRDTIALENLSDEYCWLIFSQKAFFDRTEEECRQLKEIGREIANKSKGLPLIAKTLGGLTSFKKTTNQWNAVLNSKLWELKDSLEIFAPFLLSYYDLSAPEKRCLLYCSVFPKDYVIRKSQLISMWMSQGFFGCSKNLEEEGEVCFESLAMRSFFQDFKKDEFDGRIISCKMHDIVCDLTKFLTKSEYCVLEDLNGANKEQNLFDERLRHLTIHCRQELDLNELMKYNKKDLKLRTLFFTRSIGSYMDYGDDFFSIHNRIWTLILESPKTLPRTIGKLIHLRYLSLRGHKCKVLPDAILDLYNLQTLDSSNSHTDKLPENINKLTNLRYLDLSCSDVVELPESIGDLSKLQTLKLSLCRWLKRMPKSIEKLVELRHLDLSCCYRLEGLPKGIVSLTSLSCLVLDRMRLSKDRESYLNLEDLNSLRYVLKSQGRFALEGCINFRDASDQALEIEWMESLHDLTLLFESDNEVNEERIESHEREILEAFNPTLNLKILCIKSYWGLTVSLKWIVSLVNLDQLELFDCSRCSVLPPLGMLPSLRTLRIKNLPSLEKVGPEFLGIIEEDREEKRDIEEKPCITLFPKLAVLQFQGLRKWKSWVGSTNTNAVIMPCLVALILVSCPILKELPDFLPDDCTLHISDNCPILKTTSEVPLGVFNSIQMADFRKKKETTE